MQDQSHQLAQLISTLSVANFRELVKVYNKAKYKTDEVIITDGPYDGGNDLEIRLNERTIKRNIQVTVQKLDIEAKLRKDLESARENVQHHKYLDQLDFYISQNVSRSMEENWKTIAETEYEINLTIYDATTLAEFSDKFPIIRTKTYELHGITIDNSLLNINEQDKVLFDVLALGKETGEIKKQFVRAYILSFLYANPSSSIEIIMDEVSKQLPELTDIKIYRDILSAAKGSGDLITDDSKQYSLSPEKSLQIQSLYNENEVQQALLKRDIEAVLKKVNVDGHTADIAQFLLNAYKTNYAIELEELTNKSYSIQDSITIIYNDLEGLLKRLGVPEEQIEKTRRELFEICKDNEFLNKIGASILFANLYNSHKLEDYLSIKIQHFYFDTQVLLRIICHEYFPVSEYSDIHYLAVKELYESITSSEQPVEMATTWDYLHEVAGHMQEALKLQRFFSIPLFEKINSSTNVFYNFFTFLSKNDLIEEDMTIEDFFTDLLDIGDFPSYDDPDFIYIVSGKLKSILDVLKIDSIYHKNYDPQTYHIAKREYEISLAYKERIRTKSAIENDVRMVMYLADKENHMNHTLGLRSDPFLVTWDKSFYEFRRALLNPKYQNHQFKYWFIYTPAKLADRLSLMNFKVNPKSIDYNIISLTESNFNLINKTGTFLDTLSTFFSTKNITQIKFANKLVALESKLKGEASDDDESSDKPSYLVRILLQIRSYYSKQADKKFDEVVSLFETNQYGDHLSETFEKTLDNYTPSTEQQIFEQLVAEINKLLIQSAQSPKL